MIYEVHDSTTDGDRWFSVALTGGTPQPMLDDVAIERSILDDGHRMLGYIERNAAADSHFFDPRHDKIYKASQRAFPGSRIVLTDANQAFDHLLLITEGPGDPETWWLVNIKTGHADALGYSYTVDSDHVGPMRMVPYAAADGLKMEGVRLCRPIGRPKHFPRSWCRMVARRRMTKFASTGLRRRLPRAIRGVSTQFSRIDRLWQQIRRGGRWRMGRKMQTDISDGLSELVHQGIVDPKRVCIVGASYGGYAALAGVTLQHGIYRCAVAIAGSAIWRGWSTMIRRKAAMTQC